MTDHWPPWAAWLSMEVSFPPAPLHPGPAPDFSCEHLSPPVLRFLPSREANRRGISPEPQAQSFRCFQSMKDCAMSSALSGA